MRIEFTSYSNKESDGINSTTMIARNDVIHLTELAQAFKAFLLATGFDYVTDVAIATGEDNLVWGEELWG